jgi:hypothetical protein
MDNKRDAPERDVEAREAAKAIQALCWKAYPDIAGDTTDYFPLNEAANIILSALHKRDEQVWDAAIDALNNIFLPALASAEYLSMREGLFLAIKALETAKAAALRKDGDG